MSSFLILEELILVDFPSLSQWLSPSCGGYAFPNLRKLVLYKCPKLIVMPEILSLYYLELRDAYVTLLQSFRNLRSVNTLVIEGIQDLFDILGTFIMNNSLLATLEIKSSHMLYLLPNDLENLVALKSLVIR